MGILTLGKPLNWEQTKAQSQYIKTHGIIQFINLYNRVKERCNDVFLWGDEIEYLLVSFNEESGTVKLCPRGEELITILNEAQKKPYTVEGINDAIWHAEYARYMIEGTPAKPYGFFPEDLLCVEANMRKRREVVSKFLKPNEFLITLTNFPLLGTLNFLDAPYTVLGPASKSIFLPDEIINSHPRFPTLTQHIRLRKGTNVNIKVPIFKDRNTPTPFIDPDMPNFQDGPYQEPSPDYIYMDATGFGMGCCCLQITFQACNISEATRIYDHLSPLCPIFMALSAGSPIFRGYLVDVHCRWSVISDSVDDRTLVERGLEQGSETDLLIGKSRYSSIDCYISHDKKFKEEYNDVPLTYNTEFYQMLLDNEVHSNLAKHIAHLFIRDPLIVFDHFIEIKDEEQTDHFENIQSTNWNSMRFKPPPAGSTIGWRVEFRTMEVQLTDFENAAFCIFIVLLSRVILSYDLNFYIPISQLDLNMKAGEKRNAVSTQKFYFRENIFEDNAEPIIRAMTVNEIINGAEGGFTGLAPIIRSYLESQNLDLQTHVSLSKYIKFIQDKASGKLATTAQFISDFVTTHPKYKYDSVVSPEINYDLIKKCYQISSNAEPCPMLF